MLGVTLIERFHGAFFLGGRGGSYEKKGTSNLDGSGYFMNSPQAMTQPLG